MPDDREPRSSRRRFLGTMIGAACVCGFAATATATPRARAAGVDRPARRARHCAEDRRASGAAAAAGSRGQADVPGVTGVGLLRPRQLRRRPRIDAAATRASTSWARGARPSSPWPTASYQALHQHGHRRVGLDAATTRRPTPPTGTSTSPRTPRARRGQLGVGRAVIGYVGNSGTRCGQLPPALRGAPEQRRRRPVAAAGRRPKRCGVSPPIRCA